MDFANQVLGVITQGGYVAVVTLLFAAIVVLIWDRMSLIRDIQLTIQKVYDAKDSETRSIKEIVDKYHQGNLDLVEALNEIKLVLVSIQSKR